MSAETPNQTTRMSKPPKNPPKTGCAREGDRASGRPTRRATSTRSPSSSGSVRSTNSAARAPGRTRRSTALERYVRSCETARHSRAKIPEGGTTKGSYGQLVEHPAIKTAREAERDAHKYATDLFLTPSARCKAAIESADAGDALPAWLAD
jgi:hypothetical protein